MKAVIPAAGMGSRFLPATKAQPKEMLPLVDMPTIQLVVQEAVDSGITDILIITGRGKRAIEDHFDRSLEVEQFLKAKGQTDLLNSVRRVSELANIHYIRQKEPLGLGHAVSCARNFINNEPFAIMLGDDYYVCNTPHIKQLIDAHNRLNASVISVMQVPKEQVSRFGVIDGKPLDRTTFLINSLVEKPQVDKAPSNFAISGRYIITPDVFDILKDIPPGAGGEVQLTDALNLMCKKHVMYAHLFDGVRYDIGSKIGYYKAFVEYALARDDLQEEAKNYLKWLNEKLAKGEFRREGDERIVL